MNPDSLRVLVSLCFFTTKTQRHKDSKTFILVTGLLPRNEYHEALPHRV